MFSQEKDGYLSVVFCDLGTGIPQTLPRKHSGAWQQLIRLSKFKSRQPNDSEIIREATKLGASRTGDSHRGRGLNQIANTVTNEFRGTLTIYSNAGCYSVGSGEKLHEHKTSIMGTLIAWRIPLTNPEENCHGTSYN